MAGDVVVEFKPNPELKAAIAAAAYAATKETFELDIKPEAVTNSPVTEAGLQRNLAKHRKRPGGTGTNRRSIDTEVERTDNGPSAQLFTQSGYGGYLEVGTSKMRAQPYLYPAVMKFIGKIAERYKKLIGG